MADDAEAAFLRSMQVANEAVGDYGVMGVASEQQPDSSSDEYDPAQALQADTSHETNNLSNNSSFTDDGNPGQVSNGNAPQQPPLTPGPSLAKTSSRGIVAPNTQDQSSSISEPSIGDVFARRAPTNGDMSTIDNEHSGDMKHSIRDGDLGLNGDSPNTASHSLLNGSLNQLSAADVSIQNDVQDQPPSKVFQSGISHTVPNLAAVLPDTGASSHIIPTAIPTETLPAPQVTQSEPSSTEKPLAPPAAAPRARLPHDRIGILDDRIKEDPRGDLEAWLSLIGEHRKRGKVNDARNVYERFFTVFPQAVKFHLLPLYRYGPSNHSP